MQTKIENTIELIEQAIFDAFPNRNELGACIDESEKDACDNVNNLISCAEAGYLLIEWPDSQIYMEEPWFEEEAILALG